MPQVFDVDNTDWRKEQFRLSEILSDEEHRPPAPPPSTPITPRRPSSARCIRPPSGSAFKGGRVLEPACGIGHFIGLMPEDMLRRSTVTGIEIDPLTARIAKALYPDADIRAQPFEKPNSPMDFTTSPFPTSRSAITPSTTRAGTITNFPSTIISLPPRWTRCVRAVC
jgi:SAM-dependent methyltransferase